MGKLWIDPAYTQSVFSTIIPPNASTRTHELDVPWDRSKPELGTFTLFARELYTDPSLPPLLFLQGGPGNPAPRLMQGWIPEALKHYRVFLLDERGTGRSGKIDKGTPHLIRPEILSKLRCPEVVQDAEDLRRHLGFETWDVLGNSFGALCTASYLSFAPEGIGKAFLTGALPHIGWTPDEYNEITLELVDKRCQSFYDAVPYAEENVRKVCAHLDKTEEFLPTGEKLSANRFRFIGVALGAEFGVTMLANLLESPFYEHENRLRKDFLAQVSSFISTETNPLWPVVHQTLIGSSKNVGKDRLEADPTSDAPYYLLGNHFFPHHFAEDPALTPFKSAVEEMETYNFPPLFDEAQLAQNEVPATVALYDRDMFVPINLAKEAASKIGNLTVWTHPEWDHDAIYNHGKDLFRAVFEA